MRQHPGPATIGEKTVETQHTIPVTPNYMVQAAIDAMKTGYGDKAYWDYLEERGWQMFAYYMQQNNPDKAAHMLERSLSESLRGNDGE